MKNLELEVCRLPWNLGAISIHTASGIRRASCGERLYSLLYKIIGVVFMHASYGTAMTRHTASGNPFNPWIEL